MARIKGFKTYGEYVRIAHNFTADRCPADPKVLQRIPALRRVLITPAKKGGVYVIGTNGWAIVVQYDKAGKADVPWLLDCAKMDTAKLVGGIRTWSVSGNLESVRAESDDETFDFIGAAIPESLAATGGKPGYPNWRAIIPDAKAREKLIPGFPGVVNLRLLEVISRLAQTDLEDRAVTVQHEYCERPGEGRIVVGFPWRPNTMILLMPLRPAADAPTMDDIYQRIDDDESRDL